jgi:hypothetical protein
MLRTGLDFANGTSDASKRLVGMLFEPGEILGAYRAARDSFKTSDLVLVTSEADPSGFNAMPRAEYVKQVRQRMGSRASLMHPEPAIWTTTAHAVMKLPRDSEAIWLVIERGKDLPVECVLYAVPYRTEAAAS